jgi:hypothetical protein
MADTVDTIVQFSGKRRYTVRITNVSDGTGEAAVHKVVLSGLLTANGNQATSINVRSLQWSIQGFSSVRLFWDHTTPDELAVLAAGTGFKDFTDAGTLNDPRSAGGTGDITVTTAGAAAGATYDILMELQLGGP